MDYEFQYEDSAEVRRAILEQAVDKVIGCASEFDHRLRVKVMFDLESA